MIMPKYDRNQKKKNCAYQWVSVKVASYFDMIDLYNNKYLVNPKTVHSFTFHSS